MSGKLYKVAVIDFIYANSEKEAIELSKLWVKDVKDNEYLNVMLSLNEVNDIRDIPPKLLDDYAYVDGQDDYSCQNTIKELYENQLTLKLAGVK